MKSVKGNLYIIFILGYMTFEYYTFTFVYWPRIQSKCVWGRGVNFLGNLFTDVYLGLFHVSMAMFLWSFITTIFTDPGQVPLYWVTSIAAKPPPNSSLGILP